MEVSQIDWANPYVHILMKVTGSPRPVLWAVELDSAVALAKNGWSQEALPLGETITVQGFAARDGSKQISGNSVTTSAGKKLFAGTNGTVPPRKTATGPVPRWPSGQPRLGPAPGETGYWGNPSRTSLLQDGVKVEMDAYGLLKNIGDVDKVAPMQKWARDMPRRRRAVSIISFSMASSRIRSPAIARSPVPGLVETRRVIFGCADCE